MACQFVPVFWPYGGQVGTNAPPGHEGRFSRILKLEMLHLTPTLTAATELCERSVKSLTTIGSGGPTP
jgi:hypothetical protein